MEYPLPRQRYKHYKGGTYKVITLATHTQRDIKIDNILDGKSL